MANSTSLTRAMIEPVQSYSTDSKMVDQDDRNSKTPSALGLPTLDDANGTLHFSKKVFFNDFIAENLKAINENAKRTTNHFTHSLCPGYNASPWVISLYPEDAHRNDWRERSYNERKYVLASTLSNTFEILAVSRTLLVTTTYSTIIMNTLAWHEGKEFSLKQIHEQTLQIRFDWLEEFSNSPHSFVKIQGHCRADTSFIISNDEDTGLLTFEVKPASADVLVTEVDRQAKDDSPIDVLQQAGLYFLADLVAGKSGNEEMKKEMQGRLDSNLSCMNDLGVVFAEQLNKQVRLMLPPEKHHKWNYPTFTSAGDLIIRSINRGV